jgi:hypothetical protein
MCVDGSTHHQIVPNDLHHEIGVDIGTIVDGRHRCGETLERDVSLDDPTHAGMPQVFDDRELQRSVHG